MKITNHLLQDIDYIASPNFNERPVNIAIDLIIVHNIALPPGQYGGPYIAQLFTNQLDCEAHPQFASLKDLHVASHVVIYRDGHCQQFVPFDKRAWHAGQSNYQGRDNCNDFSIGIELEGSDNVPYTDEQYDCLTAVIKALQVAYPSILADNIVGHCDVAPGRKTDPGVNFDWPRLSALLCE